MEELLEVPADRRGGYPGLGGQHTGRERATITEREQRARAGAVADEGCEGRDVGVAVHGSDASAAMIRSSPK